MWENPRFFHATDVFILDTTMKKLKLSRFTIIRFMVCFTKQRWLKYAFLHGKLNIISDKQIWLTFVYTQFTI